MVVVRVNMMNIILTLMYLAGLVAFLIMHEYVSAILMISIIYWTHRAWYLEGKSSVMMGMLLEAEEVIEKSIKNKEPVSIEESHDA